MRSSYSNLGLSKKAIIAEVIKKMSAEIDFTEREIDPLYNLSHEKLITKIRNLRGDIVAVLGAIGAIIIFTMNEGLGF